MEQSIYCDLVIALIPWLRLLRSDSHKGDGGGSGKADSASSRRGVFIYRTGLFPSFLE